MDEKCPDHSDQQILSMSNDVNKGTMCEHCEVGQATVRVVGCYHCRLHTNTDAPKVASYCCGICFRSHYRTNGPFVHIKDKKLPIICTSCVWSTRKVGQKDAFCNWCGEFKTDVQSWTHGHCGTSGFGINRDDPEGHHGGVLEALFLGYIPFTIEQKGLWANICRDCMVKKELVANQEMPGPHFLQIKQKPCQTPCTDCDQRLGVGYCCYCKKNGISISIPDVFCSKHENYPRRFSMSCCNACLTGFKLVPNPIFKLVESKPLTRQ